MYRGVPLCATTRTYMKATGQLEEISSPSYGSQTQSSVHQLSGELLDYKATSLTQSILFNPLTLNPFLS